jgi:FkbM family methyltransferase
MNAISIRRINRFFRKTREQKWTTARFLATMYLAKLSYAPHRVCLGLTSHERIQFWWSYFPASFSPERGIFDYWGDDVGELRFLWKYLRPGMTFLDVGAFHGIYSIIAAMRLGAEGRVVAFEPSPRDRRRLQLHLRCNKLRSVIVEHFAVAAGNGVASLVTVLDGYTNMSSLRPPAIDYRVKQVPVRTISLDDYLAGNKIDKVDLIKVDAEGGEIEIFKGADSLLSRLRPVVICEVLDKVTRPWGYPAREIVGCLRAYDYEWFDIFPDGVVLPHRPRNEYPEVKNYLAVPREKQNGLL